jgi:hypothetical protein
VREPLYSGERIPKAPGRRDEDMTANAVAVMPHPSRSAI